MNRINLNDLQNKNPWWSDSNYKIQESQWQHRDLFFELEKDLKNQFILSILGLRRVGKSTLMKQMIAKLLKRKIKALHIFYYLFDYFSQIKTTEFLDQLLSFYIENVIDKKVYNLKNDIYIFLDEIQYIQNWETIIKKYYDLSNKKIKFIVSGSQSILIKNKNRESLAGRIFEFYLQPLSFDEFLNIKKIKNIKINEFDLFDIDKIYFKISQLNFKYGDRLKKLSQEYLLNGQFPECLEISDIDKKNEYILESVLGKTLEDIIRLKKIEKSEEFKLVAFQLLNNISSIFELKNIGREIGLSYITLEKYLKHLIDAYLLEIFYKEYRSVIKKGRSLKKIYATTTNFICALNNYKERHFDEVPDIFGKIIENLIYNILIQKYQKLNFWRQEGKEVDFIIKSKKNILPIEVKFKKNINLFDLKNIITYCKNKKLKKAIIITKDILEKQVIKQIDFYFIPYYLLLSINSKRN